MAAINHPLGHARRLPLPVRGGNINWWVLAAIAIFGVSAMLPVLQNSTATSRGFEVQRLQAQETQLNAQIQLMEADVAQLTSLSRVQKRAQELGLGPGAAPIYIHVDEAGPAPAKLPAEYLPRPTPNRDEPESWWQSLFSWVPLGN